MNIGELSRRTRQARSPSCSPDPSNRVERAEAIPAARASNRASRRRSESLTRSRSGLTVISTRMRWHGKGGLFQWPGLGDERTTVFPRKFGGRRSDPAPLPALCVGMGFTSKLKQRRLQRSAAVCDPVVATCRSGPYKEGCDRRQRSPSTHACTLA